VVLSFWPLQVSEWVSQAASRAPAIIERTDPPCEGRRARGAEIPSHSRLLFSPHTSLSFHLLREKPYFHARKKWRRESRFRRLPWLAGICSPFLMRVASATK
jgi:hypothetical protein